MHHYLNRETSGLASARLQNSRAKHQGNQAIFSFNYKRVNNKQVPENTFFAHETLSVNKSKIQSDIISRSNWLLRKKRPVGSFRNQSEATAFTWSNEKIKNASLRRRFESWGSNK